MEGKNYIKQKPQNLDVTVLKKRSLLLQKNYIKQLGFPTSVTNIKRAPAGGTPLVSHGKISLRSIDQRQNLEGRGKKTPKIKTDNLIIKEGLYRGKLCARNKKTSLPIPLDAVFMPVTKVNCIIEENNLYSDFHTDPTNFSTSLLQTSSPSPNGYLESKNLSKDKTLIEDTRKRREEVQREIPNLKVKLNKFNLYPLGVSGGKAKYKSKIKNFLVGKTTLNTAYLASNSAEERSNSNSLKKTSKNINSPFSSNERAKRGTLVEFEIPNLIKKNEYSKTLKLKPLRKKSHLIVEIWTNGSLHPQRALSQSFMFLANNFLKLHYKSDKSSMFKSELAYGNLKYSLLNFYNTSMKVRTSFYKSGFLKMMPKLSPVNLHHLRSSFFLSIFNRSRSAARLNAPIGILSISLRTYTALKKEGILTINDLIKYSKKDLLKIPNFKNR